MIRKAKTKIGKTKQQSAIINVATKRFVYYYYDHYHINIFFIDHQLYSS